MLKLLYDAGHGKGTEHNRGYLANTKWKNEGDGNFYFSLLFKQKMLEYSNISVDLTRNTINANPSLQARANMAKNYDIFISGHTNAFELDSANGTEIFTLGDTNSNSLANELLSTITSTLSTKNRGVKTGKYAVLGYDNNATYKMLAEYIFHTNNVDVSKYENNAELLATNLAKTIASFFNLKKKSTISDIKLYRVQSGAFKNKYNAELLKQKFIKADFQAYIKLENGLYKVQLGAFAEKKNADALLAKAKKIATDSFVNFS